MDNKANIISDDVLESMLEAFDSGMKENGTTLDNMCCEDVLHALMELKSYRDIIKAHKAKKNAA